MSASVEESTLQARNSERKKRKKLRWPGQMISVVRIRRPYSYRTQSLGSGVFFTWSTMYITLLNWGNPICHLAARRRMQKEFQSIQSKKKTVHKARQQFTNTFQTQWAQIASWLLSMQSLGVSSYWSNGSSSSWTNEALSEVKYTMDVFAIAKY